MSAAAAAAAAAAARDVVYFVPRGVGASALYQSVLPHVDLGHIVYYHLICTCCRSTQLFLLSNALFSVVHHLQIVTEQHEEHTVTKTAQAIPMLLSQALDAHAATVVSAAMQCMLADAWLHACRPGPRPACASCPSGQRQNASSLSFFLCVGQARG